MLYDNTIPFEITAHVVSRGQAVFIATKQGKSIATQRYAPGDGERRRKTAEIWAGDERLWEGSTIAPEDIAIALEKVELKVLAEINRIENEEEPSVRVFERVSYLDDEVMAELAWNEVDAVPEFIVYDRKRGGIDRRSFLGIPEGKIVVPCMSEGIVTPGHPIDGSVIVPRACGRMDEQEGVLRRDIGAFIHRYVELPENCVSVITDYILLTWVYDRFDELPYLAFRNTDAGRGKSRALETVGTLCRRPLFVGGGSTAAATLRMLDTYQGTLVADEFDQARNTELASDIARIMNQGFQRNRPLVKCDGDTNTPRPFRCFGPKLFALRKRLGDDATESRVISIQMGARTRDDIPFNLPREVFDREASRLRCRLLAWRFRNYGRIELNAALASSDLEDRANQIGLPLLSLAVDDEARTRIIEALKAQQDDVASDRAESPAGEVLGEVINTMQLDDAVRPGDLAKRINERRAEQAGVSPSALAARDRITSQRVGRILKNDLGLSPDDPPRDNAGARYRLDENRLAELCRRYGFTAPEWPETLQHITNDSSPEVFDFERTESQYDAGDDCDVCDDGLTENEEEPETMGVVDELPPF